MKFINFAVVKFSVFLVFGILIAHYFPISTLITKLVLVLIVLLLGLWIWARKQFIQSVYFGIVAYLCFFAIGYLGYQLQLPDFQVKHYSHFISENETELIQLKITKTLKPDKYNLKYFANVIGVNNTTTKGKVLLNLSKDSLTNPLSPDEVLLVYSPISEIPKPLNPHQFDYSNYMKLQSVLFQLRITNNDILKTKEGSKTLFGIAQNTRSKVVEKLQKTKLKSSERAIIQALVLGEKKDLEKNLYQAYAAAGAVHILAVSGLHVGIIYGILLFLFTPLGRFKNGIIIQSILIVLLLWCFAMLSGLSLSVTRAVSMFSFFAIAKLFNRDTNTINTLFLSFLTLLLINPLWLFQVGFQLSYLAVFFIVWLYPMFKSFGYSKNIFIKKIKTVVIVSLCAQIGVLPLSLYYFHQLPGLFLLTNIVVLPFLAVLMGLGILIVLLATVDFLPDWFAIAYNYIIEGLNNFIRWVATQDAFLFKDIHFSSLKVIGSYLLIVSAALFFQKINYRRLMVCLAFTSLFVSIYIYDEFKTSSNQFIVFQKRKKTLLAYKNAKKLTVFKKDSTEGFRDSYPIKSYKNAVNTSFYSEEILPNYFQYKSKRILVLDSLAIFPKRIEVHTLLLTNSPKINLNRLIDSLKPKQIIADGSNYYSYAKRWEKTCKLKKLPFCYTAKQGAFSIE